MSLYNALFGQNKLAPILLAMLGIDQQREDAPQFPENWNPYDDGVIPEGERYIAECREKKYYTSGRFRDIYLNEDGTRIILYTRNGGGNRESYPHIFSILASHPNYITNYDDDFDCTYASFEFSIPDEYKEDIKNIFNSSGKTATPSERFQKLIKDLEAGNKTEDTEKALNVGEDLMKNIEKGLNGEGSNVITV